MTGKHNDPIDHVVVLMLENRSFDQMLGDYQSLYPSLDGIDRSSAPRRNTVDGIVYEQLPTTVRCASHDPDHTLASVLRQIGAPRAVPGLDCRECLAIRLESAGPQKSTSRHGTIRFSCQITVKTHSRQMWHRSLDGHAKDVIAGVHDLIVVAVCV